jgi:hypothetical protein
VEPNISTREVRFKLADKKAYDEAAIVAAFKGVGFSNASVKHKPSSL